MASRISSWQLNIWIWGCKCGILWCLYGLSCAGSRWVTCRREWRCPWTEPWEVATFGRQADQEESGKNPSGGSQGSRRMSIILWNPKGREYFNKERVITRLNVRLSKMRIQKCPLKVQNTWYLVPIEKSNISEMMVSKPN